MVRGSACTRGFGSEACSHVEKAYLLEGIMPNGPPIFSTLRCHFKGHLCFLENVGDNHGIWKAPSRMGRLVRPKHRMVNDGWKVDLLIVEDAYDEVGGVIHQHIPIDGREYVVCEDVVDDLHNRLTLLVRQTIGLVYELPAYVFHHVAFLIHGEAVNWILHGSWGTRNLKYLRENGGAALHWCVTHHCPKWECLIVNVEYVHIEDANDLFLDGA